MRTERRAVFAGLCTLDIIQQVSRVPGPDEKVTALRQTIAAGGPAANAAVTFAYLGGRATLVTGVGAHPLAAGIRADLGQSGVALIDAAAGDAGTPPVSSIMVTAGSGQRSVVSLNAAGRSLRPPGELSAVLAGARVVAVDAHHRELALAAARAARERGQWCLLDGGSWQDGTRDLLPLADVAVCSADFRAPGASTTGETLDYLLARGVRWAAVTQGARQIEVAGPGLREQVPVPPVPVVDTLGAGDVFHGALAYALAAADALDAAVFLAALQGAAKVAALACQSFGTRTWMRGRPGPG
ncbi:MAG: PfkB family carbohydrate kinase [Streptosporangiaceae bacterium]